MAKILNDNGHPRSLAELKKGLADLKAEAAAHAQKRVAAGLPAEAPDAFVKPEHAAAMIVQLRPLHDVLTQYLALTNGAKRLISFDTANFNQYERLITLTRESTDGGQLIYAEVLKRAIAVIDAAAQGEVSVEYVIGKLHRYLTLADGCLSRGERVAAYSGADLSQIIADYWAHYTENIAEDRRLSYGLS